MADSDPISDGSVSSKKRKLNNGSSQTKAWDSGDDSGSDLFEEHETVATQPLAALAPKRDYHFSQRPGEASLSSQAFTYRTQNAADHTQLPAGTIRQSSPQDGFSYRTQQTQPAYSQHESQKDVQVLRSSPPPLVRPAPIQRALPATRGGLMANSRMAPRGTVVRPPTVQHVPNPDINSDEDPPVYHSSDDDRQPVTSFLKPTPWRKSEQNQPPQSNGSASSFAQLLTNFRHQETVVLQPLKGARINKLDDIEDGLDRHFVKRIQSTLTDAYPVSWCLYARGMFGDDQAGAQRYLVEQNRKAQVAQREVDDLAPTPHKVAARGLAHATQASTAAPARASTKQTVGASKTIAQKYGANAVRKPVIEIDLSQDDTDDSVKRKSRKLVRGRRAVTPSPERDSSASTRPRLKQASKRTIEDDETDEDKPLEPVEDVPKTMQQRLIKFFNTSTAQEMVDLSGQPLEHAEAIVAARPFRSVAQVENVPHPTKPRANPVGLRMVEVCQDMMKGYDATAQLVDACENLAKPIQAALADWKLEKQDNGELSIAELDAARMLLQPSNMAPDVKLMPHQIVGLNWLHLLWAMRTSCILADDMGLGKTCQIISFLAQLQLDEVSGPHLVVVPASTLENWLREFARFAPSLTILPYSGSVGERQEARQTLYDSEIDVVITTYHYATSDHDFFRKELQPVVCVYDEAHQLRNPKTKKYSQTMNISRKAEFRVLLTGTPLQNNLQELVAILAFIMPDMFRSKKDELELIFKHNAASMMSGHTSLLSAQRIAKARSMITPFILRRRKAQVIALPAKHRRVEYCELTNSQAKAYEHVRQGLLNQRASGKKSTKLGNALMDMRKISIHPLLMRRIYTDKVLDEIATKLEKIDYFSGSGDHAFIVRFLNGEYHAGLDGNDSSIHRFCLEVPELQQYVLPDEALMDSGKIDTLKVLLKKYAENGDKVLLFSQFVIMLNILEPVMDILGIKYMRLDGSTDTNARQDLIDHFNDSPETTLFMLSTKAGGAGINLASANKVIIFDTGFNPQDDIQAENRAHRVGQTREVEVVRLVTKGTVEEQLLALGESKLALDERVAGDGDASTDDATAEKANAKKLEEMVLQDLDQKPAIDVKETVRPTDAVKPEQQNLKDAFASQLRKTGITVG